MNKIISNGKRFMVYEMVKRLEQKNEKNVPEQLKADLSANEKNNGQLHKVFEESFDAKPVYNRHFLLKLYTFKPC